VDVPLAVASHLGTNGVGAPTPVDGPLLRAPFGTLSSPPPHPVSEMMKIRQSPRLIEDTEESIALATSSSGLAKKDCHTPSVKVEKWACRAAVRLQGRSGGISLRGARCVAAIVSDRHVRS
jgi:hypothetical protein